MVHDESDSPLPLPPGSSSVRRTPGESRNSKPAVRSEQDQMATTEAVLGRRTCQPGTTSTTVGRGCLGQVHGPEVRVQLIAMPHDKTALQRRNWSRSTQARGGAVRKLRSAGRCSRRCRCRQGRKPLQQRATHPRDDRATCLRRLNRDQKLFQSHKSHASLGQSDTS